METRAARAPDSPELPVRSPRLYRLPQRPPGAGPAAAWMAGPGFCEHTPGIGAAARRGHAGRQGLSSSDQQAQWTGGFVDRTGPGAPVHPGETEPGLRGGAVSCGARDAR